MAIHDAMEHIKENLAKIHWPFLVLHGDADQLTMVEGSMMLEQKASSKDKTIKVILMKLALLGSYTCWDIGSLYFYSGTYGKKNMKL